MFPVLAARSSALACVVSPLAALSAAPAALSVSLNACSKLITYASPVTYLYVMPVGLEHIIDAPLSMSIERDQLCGIAFLLFLRRGRDSGDRCLGNLKIEESHSRLSAPMTGFKLNDAVIPARTDPDPKVSERPAQTTGRDSLLGRPP